MKRRMIFKFGLTIIIFVAVYMYYSIQNLQKSQLEGKENSSDLEDFNINQSHKEEEQRKNEKQKDVEKENPILKKQKIWRESIHLSVVACGDRGNETLVLLKSVLAFTKSFIIVHIFAEQELHRGLKKQVDLLPEQIREKFEYHIYGILYPEDESSAEWKKLFKPCASQRLFIPSLLTSVDSLLYVDTDIIFLSPLEEIWSHFKKFNSTQLAALAPEHEDKQTGWYNRFARHPYYGQLGVNSGVMLMNLTRMRNSSWMQSMITFHREYKLKITWGDQDLINIYFHFHPDQLYVYNCEWNFRPDHCMYMSVCKGADHGGAYILHGSRRTMHNDKQPAFKAVYAGFQEFDMLKDMKQHLLPKIKRNLDKAKLTPCGRVSHIFTKKIEYFIEKNSS